MPRYPSSVSFAATFSRKGRREVNSLIYYGNVNQSNNPFGAVDLILSRN